MESLFFIWFTIFNIFLNILKGFKLNVRLGYDEMKFAAFSNNAGIEHPIYYQS